MSCYRAAILTCEVDLIGPNMHVHAEQMLLLDDVGSRSGTTDVLQVGHLVRRASIVYLHERHR